MRGRALIFALAGLLLVAGLVFLVSPWASDEPDGITRVAEEEGFATSERDHALDDSPVVGYAVDGVDDERLSTGLAGAIGAMTTFCLTLALLALARHLRARKQEAEP